MRILGIESSADETAAAIVENGTHLLSSAVQSQINIHKQYGGIIPEVSARSHIEVILPVITTALQDARMEWEDIDAIAVTYAPGLVGSLLIGTLTAKTLALLKNKPLYPVHHVKAHVYANFLLPQPPEFPLLSLIVSGGHSQLVLFQNHDDYKILGRTQDDAIGEAFDKVAKILGLPYPGGPSIAKAALGGNPNAYPLPKAKLQGEYDFSFSGLKTAVLRAAQKAIGKDHTFPSYQISSLLSEQQRVDFAASFQKIAIETLVDKTEKAFRAYSPTSLVIAGGVAANQSLREMLQEKIPLNIAYPPLSLCTDNAAMIASLAYYQSRNHSPVDPRKLEVIPSLSM